MMRNILFKKIGVITCTLVFLTQLSLPSTATLASTYNTSSTLDKTQTTIAANSQLTALTEGLNSTLAAGSTAELSKELTATTANEISYGVTGSPIVGSTIDIAINVSSISNLYGASVDFLYDTSLLQIESINKGSLFSSNMVQTPANKIENGQASIAMTLTGSVSTIPISGSGSIAVIKAKVLKAGTINLKTTNSIDNLSLIGFTTCVKLVDNSGNKIGYTFVDKSINTTSISYTNYEESSSYIKYLGSWSSATSTSFSGSSIKYTNTANSYVEFKYNGSNLKIIGTKAASRGIAKIDIDNGAISTEVDTYNSSTLPQQAIYENNSLSAGEHTVRVYATGKKGTYATNSIVDIDRFDVNGTAIVPGNSYEDNSSFIKAVGTWTDAAGTAFSNNSIKYSNTTNNYVEFKFSGSIFKWYGTKAASRGIAKVDIDNGAISTEVDAYSSSTLTKQLLYQNNSLSNTEHTVRIYVTGKKNTAASNYIVDVDRFDTDGNAITPAETINPYEDNSSFIKTVGTWTDATGTAFSNNSIKYSNTTNAYVEFKFSGTSFKWYGTKAASRGIAKVDIDNGAISTEVDAYSSSTSTKQLLYQNISLSNADHTVRIYVTGKKNTAASNYIVDVDRFDTNGSAITPTATVNSFEDTSSFVKAVGIWTSATGSTFNNNSIKFSKNTNDYIEFKFTGTSFKWYGTKAASRGIAKVDIDNGAISTEVDAYSSSTLTKQLLYQNNSLSNTAHTVKIYVTGKKNAAASNYIVDIDNFDADGSAAAPTDTINSFEDTSSFVKATGTWTSATGTNFNNNSIKFSKTTNAYVEFKFSGTSFKWYGTKAASRGIAKIDIDNGAISTEVDAYSSSTLTKQLLYQNNSLSSATEHTVRIYVTGKKNVAASNTIVDIDKIDINGVAY